MSLEAKIEALTHAVEALTEQLKANEKQTPNAKTKPIEKDETPKEASEPAVTVEDVQAVALEVIREDRSKKLAIKKLIASYDGAKVIADVDKSKLAELAEKIKGL